MSRVRSSGGRGRQRSSSLPVNRTLLSQLRRRFRRRSTEFSRNRALLHKRLRSRHQRRQDIAAINSFRHWKEQVEAESQLTRHLDADFWANHLPGLHRQLRNVGVGGEFYQLLGLTETIYSQPDSSEDEDELASFPGTSPRQKGGFASGEGSNE